MKRIAMLLFVLSLALIPVVSFADIPSVNLTWTAPGDDGNIGTATSYDARWSSAQPNPADQTAMDAWWNAADIVPNMPSPLVAGTNQGVQVTPANGFPSGLTYYFVIRAADEVPNWSGYSNVASTTVTDILAPSSIANLQVTQ